MGFMVAAVLLIIGVFLFAVAIEGFANGDVTDRLKATAKAATQ